MTNVIHLASILSTFPSCQAILHQHRTMVSMHLSSFAMPIVAQIIVTFITQQGPSDKTSVTGLQS